MDRELLVEIGCEELPASWLPDLTQQVGETIAAQLRAHRLPPEGPAETYSTPRRLAVRVERVPERQTDLEELVNGPPVSAAFKPDGTPTPAADGFAARQGVDVTTLERVQTPKGEYLAFRRRQRGKTTVDVLPDVLGATLRGLTFPKPMRWDAVLEDGRGELAFGRPIRWILFLYGGRVVPFVIGRGSDAQCGSVQDVPSGAVTYGHRFLTTSGRAGRAIKVRSFDEYRARLLENFVILERSERHNKIARELDAKAQRLKGRVSRAAHFESDLLEEVPDLVEYPSVVAGTFAAEFARDLPEEVLTTTLVHHQHYFPVEDDHGKLLPAFLAVINSEPDNEKTISRNAERVVTARLRDARFFWETDRKTALGSRVDRLETLLFHKKLGSYRAKVDRIGPLASWIAAEALGAGPATARHAETAARLSKTDLTTDMVREFTELQGKMGGIYAREEGQPEEVWKAIYYHYLPIGVEADAAPTRAQLGKAGVAWAAVSLADKLDSMVGMFSAGERPTGSRDPLGIRRLGNGIMKILLDLHDLTGLDAAPQLGPLLKKAAEPFRDFASWDATDLQMLFTFITERYQHGLVERGFDARNVRAVVQSKAFEYLGVSCALKLLTAMAGFVDSNQFLQLAESFKRVKNLAKEMDRSEFLRLEQVGPDLRASLIHPTEIALCDELEKRRPVIEGAVAACGHYERALSEASGFKPYVDKFFDDVRVKTDDPRLTEARLRLLRRLESLILKLADISEIVAEDKQD
jgi:glycyl-tRNA synthetase beta chain